MRDYGAYYEEKSSSMNEKKNLGLPEWAKKENVGLPEKELRILGQITQKMRPAHIFSREKCAEFQEHRNERNFKNVEPKADFSVLNAWIFINECIRVWIGVDECGLWLSRWVMSGISSISWLATCSALNVSDRAEFTRWTRTRTRSFSSLGARFHLETRLPLLAL